MSVLLKRVRNYIFSVKRLYKPGEPSLIKFDDLDVINKKMDFVIP